MIMKLHVLLNQACATCGLWAKCRLQDKILWPAKICEGKKKEQ